MTAPESTQPPGVSSEAQTQETPLQPLLPPATLTTYSMWERPAKFRPAGSAAGTWPHTPWFVCTFYDPYERINVWSHGLPGIGFIVLGLLAKAGVAPGGVAMSVYCFCAAMTHVSSAITHVWPDDHVLEKIDHLCIPFLIIGTPMTAVMASRPAGPFTVLWAATAGLIISAFLRPLPRVIGFIACGGAVMFFYYWIINLNLAAQIVIHLTGAAFFIRNAGHDRPVGLQDHHFLHYCVSSACFMHVAYIIHAVHATKKLA